MTAAERPVSACNPDFSLAFQLVDAELAALTETLCCYDNKQLLALAQTALRFDTHTRETEGAHLGRVDRLGNIALLFEECHQAGAAGFDESTRRLREIAS